jgi:putative endonuclease
VHKEYYVYILTNDAGTVLYVGVTNDLQARLADHAAGVGGEFTRKYRCSQLIYFEVFDDVRQAIDREKQLKGWRRSRKEALIRKANPGLANLSRYI